jgi:hypothetical protein
MPATESEWWWLDLPTEIEMYYCGWKAGQERDLLELGDRVMNEEAPWLFTRIYSRQRDRVWAAVAYMYRGIVRYLRDHGAEDPVVPCRWRPDVERWDSDQHYMEED